MVGDAAWRAQARHDAGVYTSVLFPFNRADLLTIASVGPAGDPGWIGRTLADLVAARGGDVSDVLADWLTENDFACTFAFAIANTDEAEVARLLTSPVAFVSGSDAGAHLQMFCAAGDATLLLTRYVRDRGDIAIETAVHALTGRQAELLGIGDRGVLAPGKAADIVVFALEELVYGPQKPAGVGDKNWVQTVDGRDFLIAFRLYGAGTEFYDQTWKLDDVVKAK